MTWDMCKPTRAGGAVCFVLALLPSALTGQVSSLSSGPSYSPPQSGLWFSAGLGYGSVECGSRCRIGAPSGQVGAGLVLSPKFHVGAVLGGWTGEDPDRIVRLTIASADLRVRYYPAHDAGFFVTGGLGLGMIRLSAGSESQGDPTTGFGHAFLGGAGCDFRVSQRAMVTVFADGSGVRTWDQDEMRSDLWKLGVGLTLY